MWSSKARLSGILIKSQTKTGCLPCITQSIYCCFCKMVLQCDMTAYLRPEKKGIQQCYHLLRMRNFGDHQKVEHLDQHQHVSCAPQWTHPHSVLDPQEGLEWQQQLLAYLLTYLLTPWSRVLLEKQTGTQLLKKFPAIYGTQRVINIFMSLPPLPILTSHWIHFAILLCQWYWFLNVRVFLISQDTVSGYWRCVYWNKNLLK